MTDAAYLPPQPWLMEPAALRAPGADLLAARQGRGPVAARPGGGRPAPRKPAAGGVAMVGVYGPMTQRPDALTEAFGWCSTEEVGRFLDQCVADPSISTIVLDVDGPDGSVFGVQELAKEGQGGGRAEEGGGGRQ